MQKSQTNEELISQLLDSNLLNPKGFLSCYTGKEKDFIAKHAEEHGLLERLEEMWLPIKPLGLGFDELATRVILAEQAHNPNFLFYVFAYLARSKIPKQVKKETMGKYYATCTNIQELRIYILQEVVPKMKMRKNYGSLSGYSYGEIINLDQIIFDKEIAHQIALVFGDMLKKHYKTK